MRASLLLDLPVPCMSLMICTSWLPVIPLRHCLHLTECTVVFVDAKRADMLDPIVSEFKGCSFLVLEDVPSRWKSAETVLTALSRFNGVSGMIAEQDPHIAPEDDATIMFTSGTTGKPSKSTC